MSSVYAPLDNVVTPSDRPTMGGRPTWLARDKKGRVAVFVGDAPVLDVDARILAALTVHDGTKWLVTEEHDRDERVIAVLASVARDRGYRASRAGVEDRLSGAGWTVVSNDPRVLSSGRALTRKERDALRECDDCAALVGERCVHELVRGRSDALTFYEPKTRQEGAAAFVFERAAGTPRRPLHARSVAGHVAKLPVEFAASSTLIVHDDFDSSGDGSWIDTPYKFGIGELLINAVRMSFIIAMIVGSGVYALTGSALLSAAAVLLAAMAATALVSRGAKLTVIGAREAATTRIAPDVRVASEEQRVEERVDDEQRAAKR